MPALAFLAVAGLALIALLFFADAALERSDLPVIATSQRSGLPESCRCVLTRFTFSPPRHRRRQT